MTSGRGLIAIVMVIALLATGAAQTLVRSYHEKLVPRQTESRLSGIDTFTLGLVLGGLRGPLVMILWSEVEKQKIERDLEGIDTKIELILRLQPEFAGVRNFQLWNKAYNISVQMTSLPNKYSCILGAVKIGQLLNSQRPHQIDTLWSLADLYGNKLGDAPERDYYLKRVREETLPHKRLQLSTANADPRDHPPILDDHGFILPEFLKPRPVVKRSPDSGPDAYNGAELQYLGRYSTKEMGGFPYGVSPRAIGYNYFRRASAVMTELRQTHANLSDQVVNRSPAIALRKWAEEEFKRARLLEIAAVYGDEKAKIEDIDQDRVTAGITLDTPFLDTSPATRKKVEEAIFTFHRVNQIANHALDEYRRHMENPDYAYAAYQYRSHIDTMMGMAAMAEGDHNFLKLKAALAGFGPVMGKADQMLAAAAARTEYGKGRDRYYIITLKYYVVDALANQLYPVVAGKPLSRATIDDPNDPSLPGLYPKIRDAIETHYANLLAKNPGDPAAVNMYQSDMDEYKAITDRAEIRLATLERFSRANFSATTGPADK